MAKMAAKIDKPRVSIFRSEAFLWLIGIIVVIGIVLFYFLNKLKSNKTDTIKIILGKSDMSFFDPFPEREVESARKPELAPAEPIKKTEPVKKAKVADYFILEKVPVKKIDSADIINQARRGTSQVMVSAAALGVKAAKTEYIMSQPDWKNEPKDITSYPVDMERVLTVDRFIPAILINEINSELDGKVVAQVESNVYGAHGRKILIPSGTRAIGRYRPIKKVGTERLTIFWQRLITPSGINIHTTDAEMTDQMGRSGITGAVDNRYWDRYGMALLVSAVGSAGAYAIPVKNNAQAVVIENFGRDQQTFAKKILDEHMEIRPKITIPAGTRILITASRDIWFPLPQKRDIYAAIVPQSKNRK